MLHAVPVVYAQHACVRIICVQWEMLCSADVCTSVRSLAGTSARPPPPSSDGAVMGSGWPQSLRALLGWR